MTDLPVQIPFGTVVAWMTQAVVDGSDAGKAPDMVPMSGSVTFTPSITSVVIPDATPQPVTIFPKAITCSLDSNGFLVSPDGSAGVNLIATGDYVPSYNVSIDLDGVARQSKTILVPEGSTVDLSIAMGITPTSPPNIEMWAAIVDQITALTERAEAAAANAGSGTGGGGTGGPINVASISDATATGKAVLKATDAAAARTVLGAAAQTDVDALTTSVAGKANTFSPTLNGVPQAPTAVAGTNSPQIATTAFVKAALDALVAGAPDALNTLAEIAAQLGNDESAFAALVTTVASKVAATRTINGHALMADVVIAVGDIAGAVPTTRTINGKALSGDVVLAQGDIAGLVSALAALATLASPILTGTPKAPTPAAGDNSTNIATTAFVTAAVAASVPLYVLSPTDADPIAGAAAGLYIHRTT